MWISGASRPSSSRACSPSSGSSDSVSHPFSPAVSHGWRWLIAKRILVPLSRRERTEAVLPMVADAAWSAGSTLRLFHVAPYPQMRTGPDGRVIAYVDQETDRREAEAQEDLPEGEARAPGGGPRAGGAICGPPPHNRPRGPGPPPPPSPGGAPETPRGRAPPLP